MSERIRALAIGVIKKENKVLALRCYDKIKDEEFFRLIGGGINFGEFAQDALIREIKEELGMDVFIKKQLPITENIFEFEGCAGHEIVFPFEAEFDSKAMRQDKFPMIEPEHNGEYMEFIEITKETRIYPILESLYDK